MVYIINATPVAFQLQHRPNGDEFCRTIAELEQTELGLLSALTGIIPEPLRQAGGATEPVAPYAVNDGALPPDAPERRRGPRLRDPGPFLRRRPWRLCRSAGAPGKKKPPAIREASPAARRGFDPEQLPDRLRNGVTAAPPNGRSETWPQRWPRPHATRRFPLSRASSVVKIYDGVNGDFVKTHICSVATLLTQLPFPYSIPHSRSALTTPSRISVRVPPVSQSGHNGRHKGRHSHGRHTPTSTHHQLHPVHHHAGKIRRRPWRPRAHPRRQEAGRRRPPFVLETNPHGRRQKTEHRARIIPGRYPQGGP